MTRDQLKARILEAIDRRAPEIIAIGERIRKHPELGFKEVKTARLVEDTFKALGLSPQAGLAFTGVRADVSGAQDPAPPSRCWESWTGSACPAIPTPTPRRAPRMPAATMPQVAAMLGAAMGLLDAKAFEHLAGRATFFAVPAEEGGDLEWRVSQVKAGRSSCWAARRSCSGSATSTTWTWP